MPNCWSPIIYASTYTIDFRLIIKPEDFEAQNISWAKRHILKTIQIKEAEDWAKKLRDFPRWSLFKNETHCIVGVTCMADLFSETINQDFTGRPLHAFVGCVTKLSSSTESQLPPLTIDFFKSIYEQYVGARWKEQSYQTRRADEKAKAEYQEYPIGEYDSISITDHLPNLNSDHKKLWLFPEPNTEEDKNKFLLAAFHHEKPVSICLGLPEQEYVLEGTFLNAALINIQEKIEIDIKPKQIASETKSEQVALHAEPLDEESEKQVKEEHLISSTRVNQLSTEYQSKQETEFQKQDFSSTSNKSLNFWTIILNFISEKINYFLNESELNREPTDSSLNHEIEKWDDLGDKKTTTTIKEKKIREQKENSDFASFWASTKPEKSEESNQNSEKKN